MTVEHDPSVTSTRRLTNTAIEAMRPGDVLKDDRVPGLSVRCHGAGKSFMLYYRTKHRTQRRPKIGEYGALTIAQARDIARNMLAQVASGGDPSGDFHRARHDPVMDELWDRCAREHWNRGKTWDAEAARLYRHVIRPRIGGLAVSVVGYDDVKRVHDAEKNNPFQANRALAVLGKMLKLAERWGMRPLGSNPCQHITRFRESSRRRFATADELARIGATLDRLAEDPARLSAVAFILLVMYSGARPSEIERATPAMLDRVERDGKVFGVLRIDEGKTGRRDVFLPPQAMTVLERLPAGRRHLAGRAKAPRKVWEAVRREAGCEDLWLRDLRRTFATVALSSGVPLSLVGELLGHADPKTTKIYAKLIEDEAHSTAAGVAAKLEAAMGRTKCPT